MTITYLKGDATEPVGTGLRAIVHIVNTEKCWGAGFVLALSAKWREPELSYRLWYGGKTSVPFELGEIQIVPIRADLLVVNMLAQEGFGRGLTPPIRYEALEACLRKVDEQVPKDALIAAPRIGCGLAGGRWDRVEPIITKMLANREVTIYDPCLSG